MELTKEQVISISKTMTIQDLVLGALGEMKDCNAYKEEVKFDGDKGYLTKYLGIKAPFKGRIDSEVIDRVSITKRAFFETLQLVPLRINRIKRALWKIYSCDGGLKGCTLPENQYCPFIKEIIRAAKTKDWFIFFIAMVLQYSFGYRSRVQDIMSLIDKDNFEKHPLTEILRLKRIFMFRELSEKKTMELLWYGVFFWVMFHKKEARRFVKELNLDRIKIDEEDRYYLLRRTSYNPFGLSLEERLREVWERDLIEGNVII